MRRPIGKARVPPGRVDLRCRPMVPGRKHRIPGAFAAVNIAAVKILNGKRMILSGKMDLLDHLPFVLRIGRVRVPVIIGGFAGAVHQGHDGLSF